MAPTKSAKKTKKVINKRKNVGNVGRKRGATANDVNSWRLIKAIAKQLKQEGKLFVPRCTELCKTGHGRERAPQNPDWFYIRCAAVLRAVYMRPGNGTGSLAIRFGNKKNRGSKPERRADGARGVLLHCFKSLEKLKLLTKGKVKGRVITPEGRKRVDTIAFNVLIRRGLGVAKKK